MLCGSCADQKPTFGRRARIESFSLLYSSDLCLAVCSDSRPWKHTRCQTPHLWSYLYDLFLSPALSINTTDLCNVNITKSSQPLGEASSIVIGERGFYMPTSMFCRILITVFYSHEATFHQRRLITTTQQGCESFMQLVWITNVQSA